MLETIKTLLGTKYTCNKCKTVFRIPLSGNFLKTMLPSCPTCGSKEVKRKY